METNIVNCADIFSSYIKTIRKNLINILYRSKSTVSELFGNFFDSIITRNKSDLVVREKRVNQLNMKPCKSRMFSNDNDIIILPLSELIKKRMKISGGFPINYQHGEG